MHRHRRLLVFMQGLTVHHHFMHAILFQARVPRLDCLANQILFKSSLCTGDGRFLAATVVTTRRLNCSLVNLKRQAMTIYYASAAGLEIVYS